MQWVGHVSCIAGSSNVTTVSVRECEENSPLGGLRHRWDDIKTDVHALKLAYTWIQLAQNRSQFQDPVTTQGSHKLVTCNVKLVNPVVLVNK
jgi:hypothetical protein